MQKQTNIKRMRKMIKGGNDLYDLPLETLRPRQARRLANQFVRAGGKLNRADH
ncbi:MAG TPA: hypothetical protein VK673_21985 [Chthoniobacterales bacterium]|nr:hypothetical protein [Chthoniobacterales bacterium]